MADKSVIQLQQENLELTRENQGLKETVGRLLTELDAARGIDRSKIDKAQADLSPEQRIIEEQIRYFEAVSITRPLSLDETRTLDLLIKNKRLLQPEKPVEPEWKTVAEANENELLLIAGNVEPEKPKRRKSKASQKDPVA